MNKKFDKINNASIGSNKSPFASIPYLKKRLRRITALGLRNLTLNDFNFSVYFTLHRTTQTIPFFTSEIIHNRLSPEWSFLRFPQSVQCLKDFVMKVWVTSSNHCRLFLEYHIYLDDELLPDLQDEDSSQISDSLWFEMFGYRFTDDDSKPKISIEDLINFSSNKQLEKRTSQRRPQSPKSYSKSSIQRIVKTVDAMSKEKREAATNRQRLQSLFDLKKDQMNLIRERRDRQLKIQVLTEYVQHQKLLHENRLIKHQEQVEKIRERKLQQQQITLELIDLRAKNDLLSDYIIQYRIKLETLKNTNIFRQKEIISEIYRDIYPIRKINKYEYDIGGVLLPDLDMKPTEKLKNRSQINEITAALTFCAHLIFLTSQFLQLPLHYPIEFNRSPKCKIYNYNVSTTPLLLDPSSKNPTFHTAFIALNRDIIQIMDHCQVAPTDVHYRQAFKNLKDLMETYFLRRDPIRMPDRYSKVEQFRTATPIAIRQVLVDEIGSLQSESSPMGNSLHFSSIHSSTSSLSDQNQAETDESDLSSVSRVILPRLAMQFSIQPN